MDRKIVMLLIGIVAIGMFALPSTLAMYSGQHSFVNGTNVDCDKCHGSGDAIGGELAGSDMHTGLSCKGCHGFGANNPNADNGSMGHAATTGVTCVGCHADNSTTLAYAALSQDDDGIAVADELANGAHEPFYSNATAIADRDDVCVACHTNVGVLGGITVGSYETNISLSNYTYGQS